MYLPLRDYGRIILSRPQRLAQRTSTRANASCGLAIFAVGVHPVPYRTRKLSSHAPMVLQGQPCGRVGRRHPTSRIGSFFVCRQRRDTPLLAPKALHLTYISAKRIFCQLGFCQITYISAVEMYVIWFMPEISHGQQRKKGGRPRYGNALLRFTVPSSGDSPLPDVYMCGFTRRWCRRQACRRSEPSRCWRQRGCWSP